MQMTDKDRLVLLGENVLWIQQTVHQAHHQGPVDGCPKSVCMSITHILAKSGLMMDPDSHTKVQDCDPVP